MIFAFCGWLLWYYFGSDVFALYTFFVLTRPVFFMGLVMLLFRSDREKRILAASVLIGGCKAGNKFLRFFLSCLELFFLHMVKKIPEPFGNEWTGGLISGVSCCFAILSVYWMSSIWVCFCDKPKKMVCYTGSSFTCDYYRL